MPIGNLKIQPFGTIEPFGKKLRNNFLRRKWRRKRAGFTGDLVPVCRVRGVPSDERSMGATALGSQCNDEHNTHLVGRFFWWMLARNHLAKKPKTRIEKKTSTELPVEYPHTCITHRYACPPDARGTDGCWHAAV